MRIITKKNVAIISVFILLVITVWRVLDVKYSQWSVKKVLCSESPAMCRCYKNIVDYRMNRHEIAITHRYQQEIKQFGMVSPLEFATLEEVQHLNTLLSVCKLEQKHPILQPQQIQQQFNQK